MSEKDTGLVYVGKIIALEDIPGADFIVSATVICGKGGKWRGVVQKGQFHIDSRCLVFLPDSQLNALDHGGWLPFMEKSDWRVKMRRFKGVASEVLISHVPTILDPTYEIGHDVTEFVQVKKYHKPIPAHLNGIAKGDFPSFIPKTDELNYQRHFDLVDQLVGKPYYITEKADGSSTTAYKYKGQFGLCSRNLELERNADNGYWKIAIRYQLEEKLPEGIAIQWETCGPGIQSNPMEWKEIQGLLFSAYHILGRRYLTFIELCELSDELDFPMVMILGSGESFSKEGLETLGEGNYDNRKPREGVVVRSTENYGGKPISFKVINLDYEK